MARNERARIKLTGFDAEFPGIFSEFWVFLVNSGNFPETKWQFSSIFVLVRSSEKRRERERRIMSQLGFVCVGVSAVCQEKRLSLAIFPSMTLKVERTEFFFAFDVVLRFLGMAVCFFPQWKLEGYKWKQQKIRAERRRGRRRRRRNNKKLFSRLRLTFLPDSLVLRVLWRWLAV